MRHNDKKHMVYYEKSQEGKRSKQQKKTIFDVVGKSNTALLFHCF